MRRLVRRFFAAKISTKIILFTTVILLMWTAVFYYGFYRRTIAVVNDRVMESMMQTSEVVSQQINASLAKMEAMSDYIFTNRAFQDFALQGASSQSRVEQFRVYLDLQDMLDGVRIQDINYEIKLYLDKPTLYTSEERLFFAASGIQGESWYDEVMAANGAVVWSGFASRAGVRTGEQEDAIAVLRVLKDTLYSRENYGILKISLSKGYIKSLIAKSKLNPAVQCYLVDEGGNVVVTTAGSAELPAGLRSADGKLIALEADNGSLLLGAGDERTKTFYRVDPRSRWALILSVPYSYIVGEVSGMSRDGLLIFAFSFFVILGAATLYSRSLERRIHKINSVIGDIENKKFSKSVSVRYNDELSLVETRINGLGARVEQLLDDVTEQERAVRRAELRALQAQINPHFLYNTLDTINWMAINAGHKGISRAISQLGRFLRIVLSGGSDMITMAEELEYLQLYMDIQRLRTGQAVALTLDVDDSAWKARIPKLILQPFLENAILHGFSAQQPAQGGRVLIHVRRRSGFFRVMIVDNGAGFADSRQILAHGYPRSPMSGSSYGIANVNERLRLLYAERARVLIRSSVGVGTAVYLHWPQD